MEYIILPGCTAETPEDILAVLRNETGKRLFTIVTQAINKKGYGLNENDRLYDYLFGSKQTEEEGERTKDWNQVLGIMESEELQIRGISYDVLRKVGQLLP